MADILHEFPIQAPPERVFDAVSTPGGIDQWWAKQSSGRPEPGAEYALGFGPDYDWIAQVTACEPAKTFELEMTKSDDDWNGSRVRFELAPHKGGTWVRFRHTGWPDANEHYRISSFCWAMYLRVMRRYLEHGETVPYEERLDV
jgi:uncharacterized protein YndB with AHSA1/START domain